MKKIIKQKSEIKITILLFLVNCVFICAYGQDTQKKIMGNWYSVKSELTNKEMLDETLLFEDKWRNDTTFLSILKENKAIFVRFADTIFSNYSINKNRLMIGQKEFKIEKLSKNRMIIIDTSEEDCCRRYFFNRKENEK